MVAPTYELTDTRLANTLSARGARRSLIFDGMASAATLLVVALAVPLGVIGALEVGHRRFERIDRRIRPARVDVTRADLLFGCLRELVGRLERIRRRGIENGRYRFARVYDGENWNPDLRAPLTQPGVNVKEGEYLLAVGGRELRSSDNIYSFFEGTANRQTVIKVGPNADGSGAREVTVVPVGSEAGLRSLGFDAARDVCNRVKLISLAESLGGVETLISHPASMTHASVPPDRRAAIGLTDSLVRISVGIEDPADLIDDLKQALK